MTARQAASRDPRHEEGSRQRADRHQIANRKRRICGFEASARFRELAEDWFVSKGDRRPGTVGNWRAQIDLHLNPKLGDLRLDRIDVALIEKLRDELRAKLSAKSVNAVLTTAAAIFKLAVRRKLATGNPAADAERAFIGATELKDEATKEQARRRRSAAQTRGSFGSDEIRKVLEKAEPGYYRTLFLTAYLTGMKRRTVCAAMVGHRA